MKWHISVFDQRGNWVESAILKEEVDDETQARKLYATYKMNFLKGYRVRLFQVFEDEECTGT